MLAQRAVARQAVARHRRHRERQRDGGERDRGAVEDPGQHRLAREERAVGVQADQRRVGQQRRVPREQRRRRHDRGQEDPVEREQQDRRDGEGRSTRIALWNRAGDSVYGLAARVRRMVDTSASLLGGSVYHYQSKLTAKEPEVGGAWEWHQDYGYWYYNGCLRPDMLSIMIGLDRTNRENGCLQIATGSHKLGRIDHTPLSPTQNEVDPRRMPHILDKCPIEYCELEAGGTRYLLSAMLGVTA
ncbi:MAG: phytanoyl-CoA dioxygenase family protein, partial [Hyphomicrobiales bacterium]